MYSSMVLQEIVYCFARLLGSVCHDHDFHMNLSFPKKKGNREKISAERKKKIQEKGGNIEEHERRRVSFWRNIKPQTLI